jgi:arylsulfatase A-like enzyme
MQPQKTTDKVQRARPNILFVITDQQRADHVGFAGNAAIATPNLDALAARGSVFDQCYVANPICMPNRASLITGRVPSAHGVIFNDRALPWTSNTFVRRLRSEGYRTALIGKSHFQHGASRNTVQPTKVSAARSDPFPKGWDTWEDPDRHTDAPLEMPEDFYGFERTELVLDHGGVASGHQLHWALAKGADREKITLGNSPHGPAASRSDAWWQIFKPDFPEELYSTSYITERTIDFIEASEQAGEPWFAWCSFPDPHHPLTPPGKWYERHAPENIELPSTFDDPLTDAPKFMHLIKSLKPNLDPTRFVNPFGPDEAQVRESIAATYGMIEMIDDGVGRIVAAIDRLGAKNDTIVIFTSDHGDMMGDHGLILKLLYHYDACIRVPLVIADPRSRAGRSQALVSSLDLAQTLLELCDVEAFDDMQGHSLVPLLENPNASVRDHVLIEDDFPMGRRGGPIPYQARTVIAEEGRFTRYSSGETQLFDLTADPTEMTDLSDAPGARDRKAQLVDRLATSLMEHSDMARWVPASEDPSRS